MGIVWVGTVGLGVVSLVDMGGGESVCIGGYLLVGMRGGGTVGERILVRVLD